MGIPRFGPGQPSDLRGGRAWLADERARRVHGLTGEPVLDRGRTPGVRLTLEKAEQGREWDLRSGARRKHWIAPLTKGENADIMDMHSVRAVRSMLPRRHGRQREVELFIERFERQR